MTLAIVTNVPEGIIMASDSRQSITIEQKTPEGANLPKMETVNSDSVFKTFLLSKSDPYISIPLFQVGLTYFGQDLLGNVPMASHIKKFTEAELTDSDDVTTIPQKVVEFFRKSFPDVDTGFHIAGYRKEGKISTPYVFNCHVAKNIFERRNIAPDGSLTYGATWSGQIDVLNSIIQPSLQQGPEGKTLTVPKPPIVFGGMPLQDAIDFSAFAIRITIETIRFQARPKTVGGPIDVLALTPDGATWIQKKELRFT